MTRSLSGTNSSRRKTWWEGVSLTWGRGGRPQEGVRRCEKRRRRGLFRRLQRVGGQTLMMPRYGCQQGPSQQAEGNMSASVEAISTHDCTRQLQVYRRPEEKRRRSCFIKWWQIIFCWICTINPAVSCRAPQAPQFASVSCTVERWDHCKQQEEMSKMWSKLSGASLNTYMRLPVTGQDPSFHLPSQQLCGCHMLMVSSVWMAAARQPECVSACHRTQQRLTADG